MAPIGSVGRDVMKLRQREMMKLALVGRVPGHVRGGDQRQLHDARRTRGPRRALRPIHPAPGRGHQGGHFGISTSTFVFRFRSLFPSHSDSILLAHKLNRTLPHAGAAACFRCGESWRIRQSAAPSALRKGYQGQGLCKIDGESAVTPDINLEVRGNCALTFESRI